MQYCNSYTTFIHSVPSIGAADASAAARVDMTNLEEHLLVPPPDPTKPHASGIRWWLLIIASCIAGGQGGIWIIYSVTAEAVEPIYNWNQQTIALLSLWGPLLFLVGCVPSMWLLDVGGLRLTAIVTSFVVFAGSVARIVHRGGDETGAVFAHLGQILNGLGGPVAMSIAPKLSAVWFPPSERNAATAIVSTANYGGTALFFALGTVCVPAGRSREQTIAMLWNLNFGVAIFSGLLFLACVFSFPARPPVAPSLSASQARESPLVGLRKLRRRPAFWSIGISFAVVSGIFQGWGSLLVPNMQQVLPPGEAEKQADLIGTMGAIAGMVGGIGLGLVADRWQASKGRRKALLISCCVCAAVCFTGFAFACSPLERHVSASSRLPMMYAFSIVGSLFVNAATPLYFELCVEATFPIAEGLTVTVVTLLQAFPVTTFTALPLLTASDASLHWMNWAVVGACAFGALVLLPVEEPRRRLALDVTTSASTAVVGAAQHQRVDPIQAASP